ncbi:hypothetical protein DTO212C5_5950 [Paecilomyces variotii]|nr:hypothetical protein DTO212C5_5950 [Paecilomyces variotii]
MSVRFKRFFTNLRKNKIKTHQDDREKTCDTLFQMLQSVYDLEEHPLYITNKQAESLGIRIENITLVDDNGEYTLHPSDEFFRPLSVEALNTYPLDENDEGAKRLSKSVRCWSKIAKHLEENSDIAGQSLGGWLVQLAHARRRVGTGENATTTLYNLKTWRLRGLCPDIINEYYMGMLPLGNAITKIYFINNSYASAYRRENEPHILHVLHHFYEGNDDISRGELLTILATMVTQMEHDYLESHYITPVLVISFMNSFQGRILQAHVTNNALLLQKSKLFTFRTKAEFHKSMSLFLRWIASDRVGNTHQQVRLDRPQEKPADVKPALKALENMFDPPPTDKEPENVSTNIEEGQIGKGNTVQSVEAQGKKL